MFAIPSIGLGEVFVLTGCAGLLLLVGVVVVPVIMPRRKSDTPADDSGVNGTDEDEKATTAKTKLRDALLARA